MQTRRGGGGLIGAVAPVLEQLGGTWIAAALGDDDRDVARRHPMGRDEPDFRLRLLALPRDSHAAHYDVISNEYLWFVFHYLFDVANDPVFDTSFAGAWEHYRHVNELYADAVVQAGRADAVLVQDYHLMLLGSQLRARRAAKRPLLYFHHTPWCEPDYFSLLPTPVALDILRGMLAFDVVAFHARRWADAFLACCERFLPGARVGDAEVTWRRRSSRILVAPVPLDTVRLGEELADERTAEWVAYHDEMRAGRKLLLRVDRIDLSKNPLRGFLAFEQLLERRPKLASQVLFIANLYPSRLSVETYRRYYKACTDVVARINEKFGKRTGNTVGPVELHYEDDYFRSLGALRAYDALLVNPVFDGLNLVCKEGAFANERSGAVVLSRNAGAFEQLGRNSIPVNPFDIGETADAIELALDLPAADRTRRARRLARDASRSSPAEWIGTQLAAAGIVL